MVYIVVYMEPHTYVSAVFWIFDSKQMELSVIT